MRLKQSSRAMTRATYHSVLRTVAILEIAITLANVKNAIGPVLGDTAYQLAREAGEHLHAVRLVPARAALKAISHTR